MALTIGQTLSCKTILFILWDSYVIQRMATSQKYSMKKAKIQQTMKMKSTTLHCNKFSLGRATSLSRQKLHEHAQIEKKQSGCHSQRLKTNLRLRHLILWRAHHQLDKNTVPALLLFWQGYHSVSKSVSDQVKVTTLKRTIHKQIENNPASALRVNIAESEE